MNDAKLSKHPLTRYVAGGKRVLIPTTTLPKFQMCPSQSSQMHTATRETRELSLDHDQLTYARHNCNPQSF